MKRILLISLLILLIPALSFAADVTLSWTAPDDDRVTGYYVYYGTSNPPTTEIDASNTTQHTIQDLSQGTTYYFGAKSYDAEGRTSVMSDIIQYTIPTAPETKVKEPLGKAQSITITISFE